jgi:hypothetical protein
VVDESVVVLVHPEGECASKAGDLLRVVARPQIKIFQPTLQRIETLPKCKLVIADLHYELLDRMKYRDLQLLLRPALKVQQLLNIIYEVWIAFHLMSSSKGHKLMNRFVEQLKKVLEPSLVKPLVNGH